MVRGVVVRLRQVQGHLLIASRSTEVEEEEEVEAEAEAEAEGRRGGGVT